MKPWLKKLLLIGSSSIVGIGIILLPFCIFSISNNNQEFVFGNFQSYMSSNVQKILDKKYKINWQYYGSNAEIPTYIKNKTLDMAIATNNMIAKLILNGDIQPIPWSEFNLVSNNKKVSSYLDLQGLLTPSTWKLCELVGKSIGINNLLEYCVPYFMQDFVFSYRGNKINLSNDANFYDIFQYIVNDKNFNSKNSSIMMIDDSRTVFDVCKLMENTSNPNINPSIGIMSKNDKSNNYLSINKINDVYQNLINFYNNKNANVITFNSDSSIVLNKLALNETKGCFMYNGDAIYAALGGDNLANFNNNLPQFGANQNFWSIIPKDNFYAMDGIVLSKNMSSKKMQTAIQIIKDLCFSGLDNNESINQLDPNNSNEYKFLSMSNFAYLNYTPCYTKIYNYAIDENGYFNEVTNGNQEMRDFLINLILIDQKRININNIELPINETTKSNMDISYVEFRNNI